MQNKAFYLFANPYKPDSIAMSRKVTQVLENSGAAVLMDDWLYKDIHMGAPASLLDTDAPLEAVISLGGDGTLLRVIPKAAKRRVPVLGVNMGHVGFLLEVEGAQLERAARELLLRHYTIEERVLLEASVNGGAPSLVMNDVALTRGEYAGIINVRAYVSGEMIFSAKGDGVLVSTPTGTTGYALSAGGPIICPEVECMLIMPICTRVMHQRPVVLPLSETIRLCVEAGGDRRLQLIMDGQSVYSVREDTEVVIRRAEEKARFIRFTQPRFLTRLRKKQAEWGQE